jgi:hypothetical protein
MVINIVGVAPAGIAGVQKPWMALGFHILVTRIRLRGLTAPAIPAGMTNPFESLTK